jgi:small subunit ribosomal protein S18
MSEQENPTAEEEDTPAVTLSPRSLAPRPTFEEPDDSLDDDSDDGDEDEGEEGDDEEQFNAPAEYVQRERSGRGRRIGGEVRPDDVDYKNIPLLSRFLDRRGRILSRRKTRVSAKVQRRIVKAIKRARHLALLPYTAEQTRIVRRRR